LPGPQRGGGKPPPLTGDRRRVFPRPPDQPSQEKHEYATRALQLFEQLKLSDPEQVDYELFHAKTLIQLASSEMDNLEKQQAWLQQAKQELEQLSDRYPENPEYEYALGIFYFTRTGRSPDETIDNMLMANQIGKQLHQSYPLNIRYRQLYARTSFNLARQYQLGGDNQKARENMMVALSMWSDLSNETDDIRYFYQKTYRQLELARAMAEQEKLEDAKGLLLESIAELQSQEIHQLATRHTKRLQKSRTGPAQAFRSLFREPNPDKLPREDEFWMQYRRRLVDHYELLSDVLDQLGDADSSAAARQRISQIRLSDLKQGIFPAGI